MKENILNAVFLLPHIKNPKANTSLNYHSLRVELPRAMRLLSCGWYKKCKSFDVRMSNQKKKKKTKNEKRKTKNNTRKHKYNYDYVTYKGISNIYMYKKKQLLWLEEKALHKYG